MGRIKPVELIEIRKFGELNEALDRERIKINALLYASYTRDSLSFVRYDLSHLNSRDRNRLEREYSELGAKLVNPDQGSAEGYSNPADCLEFNFPIRE